MVSILRTAGGSYRPPPHWYRGRSPSFSLVPGLVRKLLVARAFRMGAPTPFERLPQCRTPGPLAVSLTGSREKTMPTRLRAAQTAAALPILQPPLGGLERLLQGEFEVQGLMFVDHDLGPGDG